MKRLTSIFLVLAMLLTLAPMNIFAAEAENAVVEEITATMLEPTWEEYLESNGENFDANTIQLMSINEISSPMLMSANNDATQETTEITRYTVLALDTSGSMSGSPMTAAKAAAIKFCEDILKANGKNYVALITLNSSSSVVCNFTDDIESIKTKINNLSAYGGTNVNDALVDANAMLSGLTGQNIIKNIVILSDGLPQSGDRNYDGPYTSSDYYDYAYANPAYHNAQEFKKTNYIYTLGFFHSLYGSELTFGRKFMSDLQNAGYFDVTNVDDLEFVFGDIAEDITNKAKAGTFIYASGSDRDYQGTYYYDDNYFTKDSTTYNKSLASMSLCLAISAFGSNNGGDVDYTNKFQNAKNLLCDELGFEKFERNDWFTKKPTSESIGVVAAQKKIKDEDDTYTLIAVAVRGGGYESEWASNFTIGTSGQASGFANAKGQVIDFIKNYIANEENEISGKIKIWITGYSRAAATSNLVAGAIDDNLGMFGSNVSLDKNDLFAYCFETPMGALKSEKKAVEASDPTRYKNIWNIVNKNDPVTKVAMTDLGFTRYGTDHYLPDKLTSEYFVKWQPIMLGYYNSMSSYSEIGAYNVDDFQMKKLELKYVLPGGNSPIQNDTNNNWTQGKFLDETVSKLTKEVIKTRTNYVNEFQNGIRVIFTAMYGTLFEGYDQGDAKKFLDLFMDRITDLDVLGNLLWKAITSPDEVDDVIENIVTECLNECGMNNINPLVLADFVGAIAKLVVQFATTHPNLTTTLICNIGSMGAAHYPELCFAWLMTEDKNYTTDPVEFNGTGSYRVIRINCPVDVDVYDADGNLVAKIEEDVPQSVADSNIVSSINEDGEKLITLPITAEYSIKMNATADGEVNYSVSEFSDDVEDNNRILNYFNINVNTGDTLTGNVPAYSDEEIENGTPEGSAVVYTLHDTENNLLQADVDLSGDDATDAYFTVTVSANNDEFGIVSGQGIRQLGNFAQLEAIPNEGYNFVGWYKNDELLSTDTTYRFAVTEDVSIIGKFSDGTKKVTFISDGEVIDTIDVNQEGKIDTLPNVTKSGYNFNGWYLEETFANKFTTDTVVSDSMTVYAKWTKRSSGGGGTSSYTIKFDTDGGSKVSNKSIRRNNTLAEPTAPTKDGFTFEGWYTDKELTKSYDFASKVTKSFTLYAKWEDVKKSQIILKIGEKEALVFGETKENDVAPKIVNDRTMLPIRFIAEALGAEVEWDGDTRKVSIIRGDIEIIITIDSNEAIVNGKIITLDSPAFIENNRTYLPLRFISENLGALVEWDGDTSTVTITK
jgi:uncharacterized repeat protein (TIGR02543 family)